MKACSKCKVTQPPEQFYPAKHHSDGLSSHCRVCRTKYHRAYRIKNRLACRARVRAWEKANPEKAIAKASLYARRYPAKINARIAKREAAKEQRTPKWLTPLHFQQISIFYSSAAALTKELGLKFSVDHIIPLRGENVSGLHVPWNLQIITLSENCRKSNKVLGAPA